MFCQSAVTCFTFVLHVVFVPVEDRPVILVLVTVRENVLLVRIVVNGELRLPGAPTPRETETGGTNIQWYSHHSAAGVTEGGTLSAD